MLSIVEVVATSHTFRGSTKAFFKVHLLSLVYVAYVRLHIVVVILIQLYLVSLKALLLMLKALNLRLRGLFWCFIVNIKPVKAPYG